MFTVKLTKIESTHANLRTDKIVGETQTLPQVGVPFILYADALSGDQEYTRIITTSPVKSVLRETATKFFFETSNSSYQLDLIEPDETKEAA